LQQQEIPEDEDEDNDEDYVEQVFEGSLVHYYPDERRISKLEKRYEFTGAIPKFLGFQDLINPEVFGRNIMNS
jgi:hypothetical protein